MTDTSVRNAAIPRHPIEGLPDTQDQLFGMLTALAAQLAVTRERLDTVERLAQAAGLFGPDDVDSFQPDGASSQARDGIRQHLIARIFRPVQDASVRTARLLRGEGA
ncbi:hypothetical protein LWE61_07890 [Sphingobium sufflavum]|uniref:hypothetical protein n=1 Tax=Sphingobium sufflavum TaxID=1129547 RepID=UPI001F454DA4|nr:hypothetical protein [Sphingobium sufflavum]MCE7796482.1 hypothetical protein [Sphingobium sufflavum]